jgi:23S rRNA (adenine2503-C2)-methyltransferase
MDERIDLLDRNPDQLKNLLADWGEPAYRAAQINRWIYQGLVNDFDAMTDLPGPLRARLKESTRIGQTLETVLMLYADAPGSPELAEGDDGADGRGVLMRRTVCISTQVGCPIGCPFCATGQAGYIRNLRVGEILAQVLYFARERGQSGYTHMPLTNVVIMGMGEPLMNWRAVNDALTLLNDPLGLGLGARHITVSTVGVLPGIVALGERPEQFRLAISIHAPSDALRRELMPVNVKYPLADVIQAAKQFDRRVTFEYVMLGGVNDATEHAIRLAELARECRAFVNLIPLHPGGARGFVPTPPSRIRDFAHELRRQGVEVAIRKSRGVDIAAACGQLRVERLGRRPPRGPDQHGDVQVA